MKNSRIPTILALFLLIVGLASGVFLVQSKKLFHIGATPASSPQDLRITNVNGSSFTLSWVTDKETIGQVFWGKSAEKLDQIETDKELRSVHVIDIGNLSAKTSYYFKLGSDGDQFDNSGIPYSQVTGADLGIPDKSLIISGTVLTKDNSPAQNVSVFITGGGIAALSSQTSSNGTWLIPLSNATNSDFSAFAKIKDMNTAFDIFVQAGANGVATAKINLAGSDPIPPITLGTNQDLRSQKSTDPGNLPEASINPPPESSISSGFHIPATLPAPQLKVVTLESIKNGEVITSVKPQFFGQGPKNSNITITVESESITGNSKIGSTGSWSWSPPKNLEAGQHKITISWRDETGILRNLTRNFVVQAAEAPAFVASPSATISLTPTKIPSPTPTIKQLSPTPTTSRLTPSPIPTITSTPIPSLTSTLTNTPTPTKVPNLLPAGNGFPTMVGIASGVLLLLGALILAI